MRSAKRAVVYRRRMSPRMRSEPLWSGMWKWCWNLGDAAQKAMISSVSRFGSIDEMR